MTNPKDLVGKDVTLLIRGGVKVSDGYFCNANSMISCHMGAMMNAAILFSMGVLSLLPAHAPSAIPGV